MSFMRCNATSNLEVMVYSRPSRLLGPAKYLIVASCLACGSSTDPSQEPQSIAVTVAGSHTVPIIVGSQVKLTVAVKNAVGEEIVDVGPLAFTSRNSSIASVDAAGMLSAVHFGSTYVLVTLLSGTRTLVDSLDVDVGALVQQAGR
jgi:hypothetical protein